MTGAELAEPNNLPEACALLGERAGDARLISGGTAVVLMIRQGLIAPGLLVSINRVPDLSYIDLVDGRVRIGGRTTLTEIAASTVVRRHAPSLARACEQVGNIRVRNVATLAGNLAEADYASDPPAVLACLGAECTARGRDTTRTIAVSDLITGFYSTSLSTDEIISEIDIPASGKDERSTYIKYVSRSSEDRPCLGVSASVRIRDGAIQRLNVTIGAVGPVPASRPDVCRQSLGRPLDAATIGSVADGYADTIDPLEDARGSAWYRREMIRVFVGKALQELAQS